MRGFHSERKVIAIKVNHVKVAHAVVVILRRLDHVGSACGQYSILDDEWLEVREIMERWLAPSNFDQDGKAKTSMATLMEERGPSRRA